MSDEPRCNYCGWLGWTVAMYGRITHKENCPNRTEPWSQLYPQREEDPAITSQPDTEA